MTALMLAAALFLLLNIAAALLRVWRGPTAPDRMVTTLLLGTTGSAVLMLLAQGLATHVLRDVSLVLALLAAISTVAFVRRGSPVPRGVEEAAE